MFDTVDSIMKGFTKAVVKLNKLAESKEREAVEHSLAMTELSIKKDAARLEMRWADRVAKNINDLLEG